MFAPSIESAGLSAGFGIGAGLAQFPMHAQCNLFYQLKIIYENRDPNNKVI
jgi:hypothetical protein